MKVPYLDLPQGTQEYVVVVPTQVPDEVDPRALDAQMSIMPRGEVPLLWEDAVWLDDPGGWGLLVDTDGMEGDYDVRVRLDAGVEAPMLGPVRLRVLVG